MLLCFKGSTNSELVGNLQRYSIIESHRVAAAMEKVDRGDFVSENPYQDSPQYIGYGATISAPHMHAYALEHLKDCLNPGSKVLDVGCGSGYLTTCLQKMAGSDSLTVGIDHMKGLTDLSVRNIRKNHADLLESGRIKIVLGDGREGYPSEAPYDCIHVGAASLGEPTKLLSQLANNGRMFVPVEEEHSGLQSIFLYIKDRDGKISSSNLMGVQYIPLTDPEKQH